MCEGAAGQLLLQLGGSRGFLGGLQALKVRGEHEHHPALQVSPGLVSVLAFDFSINILVTQY